MMIIFIFYFFVSRKTPVRVTAPRFDSTSKYFEVTNVRFVDTPQFFPDLSRVGVAIPFILDVRLNNYTDAPAGVTQEQGLTDFSIFLLRCLP